jgi:cysteine desulfurase
MEPSHVLKAMNVPLSAIHGSVRFCVSGYTTEEETDALVEKVSAIVKRLREISPFGHRAAEAERGPSDEQLQIHKAYFARA